MMFNLQLYDTLRRRPILKTFGYNFVYLLLMNIVGLYDLNYREVLKYYGTPSRIVKIMKIAASIFVTTRLSQILLHCALWVPFLFMTKTETFVINE